MKRWTWLVAVVAVAGVQVRALAQTTDATTPTSNPTFSQGSAGVGTGPGIGTQTTTGSFSGGTGTGTTGGAGFSGGAGFAGAATGGQLGGAATGRAGGTTASTSVPTTYNPFRAAYVNPFAKGAGSTKTFGQPILAAVSTTTAGGVGGARGAGLARGAATTGLQGAGAETASFSTVGIRRAPGYGTTLGRDIPIINVPTPALLTEIRATFDNATSMPSKNGVQVSVEGSTVILRGQVEDDRERRVMEGIIRLTPGVREIRNELVTR